SSSHLHHSQPITERSEYWRSTIGNFEEKTSLSNGKPEWRCHSGHKDPIVSDLPHHRHQILIQLGSVGLSAEGYVALCFVRTQRGLALFLFKRQAGWQLAESLHQVPEDDVHLDGPRIAVARDVNLDRGGLAAA